VSDAKIGTRPDENSERDAVHVAIAPVIAYETLQPGDRVVVVWGGRVRRAHVDEQAVAIVDPFLREPTEAGDRVWVLLVPGTPVGLRHYWQHKDFPDRPSDDWDPDDGCRGCW
jgi:hypothetical protein